MNRLKTMMVVVGVMSIGGVSYLLATRQPPEITMAELRDAGAASLRVDRWVACGPEKIDQKLRNNLRANGYGTFAVGSVHRICRVIWEYIEDAPAKNAGDAGVDAGVCEDDFEELILDGGWCRTHTALNLSLIVDLLRDAGEVIELDGGDEEDLTDNPHTFRLDNHYRLECNNDGDAGLRELRLLPDAGFRLMRADGGEIPWCNAATRRGRVVPPCVVPNCWNLPDGGWNDSSAPVDCFGVGLLDGGYRWKGCNVMPAYLASPTNNTTCIPVECSVVGNDPIDVLR